MCHKQAAPVDSVAGAPLLLACLGRSCCLAAEACTQMPLGITEGLLITAAMQTHLQVVDYLAPGRLQRPCGAPPLTLQDGPPAGASAMALDLSFMSAPLPLPDKHDTRTATGSGHFSSAALSSVGSGECLAQLSRKHLLGTHRQMHDSVVQAAASAAGLTSVRRHTAALILGMCHLSKVGRHNNVRTTGDGAWACANEAALIQVGWCASCLFCTSRRSSTSCTTAGTGDWGLLPPRQCLLQPGDLLCERLKHKLQPLLGKCRAWEVALADAFSAALEHWFLSSTASFLIQNVPEACLFVSYQNIKTCRWEMPISHAVLEHTSCLACYSVSLGGSARLPVEG